MSLRNSGFRRVLLIAFHFPPFRGSSGMQRTLRFAQHLPACGWHPIVLSVSPLAYGGIAGSAGSEVPDGLAVHRALGLDAARHFSIFGRYPRWLSDPDRWVSWRAFAVPLARRLIRSRKIDVVWSTFPIATAHAIGLQLTRKTAVPWVAEFRDPMWQGEYPHDPVINRHWRELERDVFSAAKAVVVVTPGAADMYRQRFGDVLGSKISIVENGYDDATFVRAGAGDLAPAPDGGRPKVLLHSGVIYPSERDPTEMFRALSALKSSNQISQSSLQVVLRASGNERAYQDDLFRFDIADIVQLAPSIDYADALREMLTVDGLLILQASNCNAQIPAKLYEYLRAGRPILALTDPQGDTAGKLRDLGTGTVARLDSCEDISAALLKFLAQIRDGGWNRASPAAVAACSREAQTRQLAQIFEAAIG